VVIVGTLTARVCLCVSIGGGVWFLLGRYLSGFWLGSPQTQSRGPIKKIDYDMSKVSTRNGMFHPSFMGLAVQPWPHPHQVEIEELQVPHAYVEDESLWLAQLDVSL
jgi:hypothetical protein